jgi:hypothetical protein
LKLALNSVFRLTTISAKEIVAMAKTIPPEGPNSCTAARSGRKVIDALPLLHFRH